MVKDSICLLSVLCYLAYSLSFLFFILFGFFFFLFRIVPRHASTLQKGERKVGKIVGVPEIVPILISH